jgi:hypothetical protein
MKYEKTALAAIRFRARATGEMLMTVEELSSDLGGPVDLEDVLASLHARGLINLHLPFDTLALTAKGRAAEAELR